MSLPDKAFPVSWDQFHRDARALAWRISGMGHDWRAIVAITRGGLVPAAIICRELGIRLIETVCIASYHDYTSQGEMQILKGIGDQLLENVDRRLGLAEGGRRRTSVPLQARGPHGRWPFHDRFLAGHPVWAPGPVGRPRRAIWLPASSKR